MTYVRSIFVPEDETDVPRMTDGTAIIGDPRNDEHVVIAGMLAAFLRFHNNVVDRLRAGGTTDETKAYSQACRLTTWHYHADDPARVSAAPRRASRW